jgi:DNA-binding SARP family transcriptional activator/predicted ATPase
MRGGAGSWEAPPVDYLVLGPVEVRDAAGRPVPLGPPRQRALLAVLALSAGRMVPLSRLVDELWGEAVPDSASKMVQIHISQLRKVLPRDDLVTRSGGYLLDIGPARLDLGRFERLQRDAREAAARGDASSACELLRQALALWRGPALAEFTEPFARLEADRLEELRLTALEERMEADLALGRHAELVGELEALIARNPLREGLRGKQMLALYRAGRQAEALAAYAAARSTLSDELGIEPSPELRELHGRILRQDPGLHATAIPTTVPRPARGGLPRPGRPPVGRERALEALSRLHADTLAGERRVALVTGEAGIGKTTLVEAFAASAAREAGTWVARGQCIDHRGAGEPYMPVLEALGRLARGPAGDRVVEVLAETAPTWLVQMPSVAGPDELEAARRRSLGAAHERMLREMVDALEALAARAPLILLLEDLHWCDLSTLDLLEAIARRPEPARLLVLGTFRPGDAARSGHPLDALARDLRSRGLSAEVRVEPLTEPEIDEYLLRRLPVGTMAPGGLAASLLQRTGGNCLFIATLVDSWVDDGILARGRRARVALGELMTGIPETVRELIEQMLLQLGEEDRAVLEAASVVGTRFSAAAAASASERPLEDVEGRCASLAREQAFLMSRGTSEWPDGTVSTEFAFSHDLSREVLYERIPAGRRAGLHGRLGIRLESAFGERAHEIAPLLASHFRRSADGDRAVRYLELAADRALRRSAHHEVIGHLTDAIAILRRSPDGAERTERELRMRITLGNALISVRGYAAPETRASYARARRLCERLGDGASFLPVLYGLWNNEIVAGRHASALELGEAFVRLAEERDDGSVAVAHRAVALPLLFMGRLEAAGRRLERIPVAYDPDRHADLKFRFGEDPGVAGAAFRAWQLWLAGRPDAAARVGDEAVDRARAGRHPLTLVYALLADAFLHQFRREHDEVLLRARAAGAHAAEHGIALLEAWARHLEAWGVAREGDLPDGISRMRAALDAAAATGAVVFRPYLLALLSESLAEWGRRDEARSLIADAAATCRENRELFWQAEIHRAEGDLRLAGDPRDDAGAEEAYLAALRVARLQSARSLELRAVIRLGCLMRDQGRSDEAHALVGGVLAALGESSPTPDLAEARELLGRA